MAEVGHALPSVGDGQKTVVKNTFVDVEDENLMREYGQLRRCKSDSDVTSSSEADLELAPKSERKPRRRKTREQPAAKRSPRSTPQTAAVAEFDLLVEPQKASVSSDDEDDDGPPVQFCNVNTDFSFAESRYAESMPSIGGATTAQAATSPRNTAPAVLCPPENMGERSTGMESMGERSTGMESMGVRSTGMESMGVRSVGMSVTAVPVYYPPMMAVAVPMPVGYTSTPMPAVQEDLPTILHRETGVDLAELEALFQKGDLQKIPRNDEGQITSVGSISHCQSDASQCAPCVFWFKGSCGKGIKCVYCHFRHEGQKAKRIRPSKKTREKLKAESSSTASDISDSEARIDGRKVR